jgi:hypothetical protein
MTEDVGEFIRWKTHPYRKARESEEDEGEKSPPLRVHGPIGRESVGTDLKNYQLKAAEAKITQESLLTGGRAKPGGDKVANGASPFTIY